MKIKKNRYISFIFSFIFLSTITFNYIQKSIVDKKHTHYKHDSIVYIHTHKHSNNTHYHSSNIISILDYFNSTLHNNNIIAIEKTKNIFEHSLLYSFEIKNKLFKPPTIS